MDDNLNKVEWKMELCVIYSLHLHLLIYQTLLSRAIYK